MTTKLIRWKLPSAVLAAILLDPKTASGALTDLMQLSTTTITAVSISDNNHRVERVLDNDPFTYFKANSGSAGEVF